MEKTHAITVRMPAGISTRLQTHLLDNPQDSATTVAIRALDAFLPNRKIGPTKEINMSQNAESGREGYEFGLSAGRALAERLGTLISPTAAVLRLRDGRVATIRTAKAKNTTWGCLNTVREQVDTIICAHTADGKAFDLWELNKDVWQANAREASSGSSMRGKLTQMSKSAVRKLGRELPQIHL